MLCESSWRPDAVLRLFLGVFVCLCLGGLGAGLVRHYSGAPDTVSPWRAVVAALCFQGAALLFVRRFLEDHELRWRQAFGWLNDRRRALVCGVVAAFFFMPVGWALQVVMGWVLGRFNWDLSVQPAVQALENNTGLVSGMALGFVVIVLAPLAEEILFRGILYPFIKQFGFRRLALWSTSIIFAAIHANAVAFVPLLVFSIVLSLLYEYTGNLIAPIAAHALFNAVNFGLLFAARDFVHSLPSQ